MTDGPKAVRDIGGRRFRVVQTTTIEHDIYLSRIARAARIDKVRQSDRESRAEFSVRLYEMLVDSGKTIEMLAGILIPNEISDTDWTPKIADSTAAFLKAVTDESSKMEVRSAIIEFSVFFAFGLLCKTVSRTASEQEQPTLAPA